MQIPRDEFAYKFQGTLWIGQKEIITFLWKSGLSSASRNHLTTFCRPFVHDTCLRLCSAMVHFIRNNCLYFVCNGWSTYALTALDTLPISVTWQNRCTRSNEQLLT